MKINFELPKDGQVHTYCANCMQETTQAITTGDRKMNSCTSCGHEDGRALIIDPAVEWWVAADGEYWHETAGVFVINERGEMLLFDRTRFPFGLTPPAGHVDKGELAEVSARRELKEETGIKLPQNRFSYAVTVDIIGDGCRRGADIHRWHAFVVRVKSSVSVQVDESEGSRPVWLTLSQALARDDLTFATRYMLENYADAIIGA